MLVMNLAFPSSDTTRNRYYVKMTLLWQLGVSTEAPSNFLLMLFLQYYQGTHTASISSYLYFILYLFVSQINLNVWLSIKNAVLRDESMNFSLRASRLLLTRLLQSHGNSKVLSLTLHQKDNLRYNTQTVFWKTAGYKL